MLQDIWFGLRSLRRSLGFASIAIVTLALGIGANTALFSVVYAVLLRPFGYAEPERLVQITGTGKRGESTGVSVPDFVALSERARTLERVGTSTIQMFTLLGPKEPENIYGQLVSSECFATLGTRPLMGRLFAEPDFRAGAPAVAILSHRVWQNSFAGDPNILGRGILLNGATYSVIAVMGPEFLYPHPVFRIWTPWRIAADSFANRQAHSYTLVARLRRGATRKAAQAELDEISKTLARESPATNDGWRAVIAPVNERTLGFLRPILLALLGAVGFTLLIACLNVGNLAMARGIGRAREIAVRAALGASRWRIARQLLTESLIVALAGGALGVLVAKWSLRGLVLLRPSILPGAEQATIDARMLAGAAAVSLVCGVLFGLLPALRFSAVEPGGALQEGARGATGSVGQRRALTALVTVETALTVILLAGAGLLLRSLSNLTHAPLGFQPERVLTLQIPAPWNEVSQRPDRADIERRVHYLQDIEARMRALPGVTAAGIISTLPFGPVEVNTLIHIEGRPAGPGDNIRLLYRSVSPEYFRAMGVRLLRGRTFTDSDRAGGAEVAVVNDAMARKNWPGEDALGKRFSYGAPTGPWVTVVGVIAASRTEPGQEASPELYTSLVQRLMGPQISTIVLRTAGDPAQLGTAARAAIRQANPNQPVSDVKTMTAVMDDTASRPRLYAVLLAVFAGLALVLAAAGIFSVISWTVSHSTREIGIRMALGAAPGEVVRQSMRRALIGAGAGAALGLGGAAALTRFLQTQLYGVTATDPATFAAAPVLLLLVAAGAAYWPARRATRVDPVTALR